MIIKVEVEQEVRLYSLMSLDMEKLTKNKFCRCYEKEKYLTDTGDNILQNFGLKRSKIPWNKSARAFIPKLNKPTEMCTNLNGKPAR